MQNCIFHVLGLHCFWPAYQGPQRIASSALGEQTDYASTDISLYILMWDCLNTYMYCSSNSLSTLHNPLRPLNQARGTKFRAFPQQSKLIFFVNTVVLSMTKYHKQRLTDEINKLQKSLDIKQNQVGQVMDLWINTQIQQRQTGDSKSVDEKHIYSLKTRKFNIYPQSNSGENCLKEKHLSMDCVDTEQYC